MGSLGAGAAGEAGTDLGADAGIVRVEVVREEVETN